MRLRKEVIDKAMRVTGAKTETQLSVSFLERSGATIRNWKTGNTLPDAVSLMRLHKLTGVPIEEMLEDSDNMQKAAV